MVKEQLKGMFGMLIGATIGSAAISQIGNSNMSSGLKNATQSLVGVGILSSGMKLFKIK